MKLLDARDILYFKLVRDCDFLTDAVIYSHGIYDIKTRRLVMICCFSMR
jgi:hypothetical protein